MKKLPVTLSKTEFGRGLGLICFQQLVLPVLLSLGTVALSLSPTDAELNFAYFLINYISVLILFRNFLWAELEIAVERPGKVFSSIAIGYGLYYVISTGIGYLVDFIDPEFLNLNDENIGAMSQNQFALITVGTVLLVPMSEELLFRGVLFNYIYEKRPVIACFTSIVLFSMIHLIGFIGEYSPLHFALAFLQYLPAGIVLCFTYVRSGTIFTPILFHTLVNVLAMIYQYSVR
jgi:membrane protease YdiL (CAAX protease family)